MNSKSSKNKNTLKSDSNSDKIKQVLENKKIVLAY